MCQCINKNEYMKKYIICIFSILFLNNCKTKEYNADNNFNANTSFEFSITTNNFYYSCVPIKYKFSYPDTMDITLSGKNVRIAEEYNNISIHPRQNSIYNKGEIYVINNKTGDTLQTKIIYGILPPIAIYIGGRNPGSGLIHYNDFINSGSIIATIENFDIDLSWHITSFTLEMQSGDSIISISRNYPPHCEDWKLWEHWKPWEECLTFSQEQLKALETIQGTQIIVLKDIVVPLDSNVNYVIDHAVWYVKREKE